MTIRACNLGSDTDWGFAIYQATTEIYNDSLLPDDNPSGTPEQASTALQPLPHRPHRLDQLPKDWCGAELAAQGVDRAAHSDTTCAFRLSKVDDYLNAYTSWLTNAAHVIDTRHITASETANQIAKLAL